MPRREFRLECEGSWIRVKKCSTFLDKFSRKISIFHAISQKKFDLLGKDGPFTVTSGQIIISLFKSHLFRTYFMYLIRYKLNNISRPPCELHDPLPKIWGLRPPIPRIDALDIMYSKFQNGDFSSEIE